MLTKHTFIHYLKHLQTQLGASWNCKENNKKYMHCQKNVLFKILFENPVPLNTRLWT